MNKKAQFMTILLLGLFVASIYSAALTKAVVASDQLELEVDTSVTGKLYYTNTTVTDHLVFNPTITVESIVNATDVNLEFYLVKVAYEIIDDEYMGGDEFNSIEFTHVIFKHNRTTLLGAGRLFMGNSTFSVTMTVLHHDTVAEWTDLDNTKITFNNGTTYIYGDMVPTDFGYNDILGYMLAYAIFNFGLSILWVRTLIGINPNVNVGDKINFYDTNTATEALADVTETVEITTSGGKAVETIHVYYEYTSLFGWDDYECDAFYETKTGLLVRIIETDGIETFEFVPETVNVKVGIIPFPTVGIIVGFMAIGLVAIFSRFIAVEFYKESLNLIWTVNIFYLVGIIIASIILIRAIL